MSSGLEILCPQKQRENMKKSNYDKRLFGLAESLIRDIERADKPVQPEDLMLWIQTHVPRTETEEKEFEEELAEMMPDRPSPGRSSINELRQALGFTDEMCLLSVIRSATEVCRLAKRLPKTADGVPFFIGDTLYHPNDDREYFGTSDVLEIKVDAISHPASFAEYRGDFTVSGSGHSVEGGNLDFYASREACPKRDY